MANTNNDNQQSSSMSAYRQQSLANKAAKSTAKTKSKSGDDNPVTTDSSTAAVQPVSAPADESFLRDAVENPDRDNDDEVENEASDNESESSSGASESESSQTDSSSNSSMYDVQHTRLAVQASALSSREAPASDKLSRLLAHTKVVPVSGRLLGSKTSYNKSTQKVTYLEHPYFLEDLKEMRECVVPGEHDAGFQQKLVVTELDDAFGKSKNYHLGIGKNFIQYLLKFHFAPTLVACDYEEYAPFLDGPLVKHLAMLSSKIRASVTSEDWTTLTVGLDTSKQSLTLPVLARAVQLCDRTQVGINVWAWYLDAPKREAHMTLEAYKRVFDDFMTIKLPVGILTTLKGFPIMSVFINGMYPAYRQQIDSHHVALQKLTATDFNVDELYEALTQDFPTLIPARSVKSQESSSANSSQAGPQKNQFAKPGNTGGPTKSDKKKQKWSGNKKNQPKPDASTPASP
ncbi:hypothetical protein FF38_08278 [Lucilia cuprina]|uniref:Uncharacterized protein n=1 Tax=Lucilia cuprina TaxID=7375 RepID=A0A0L0CHS5_LUCCU|nr:hypothetical protein FF38_08278 [Lucilia cuprina]